MEVEKNTETLFGKAWNRLIPLNWYRWFLFSIPFSGQSAHRSLLWAAGCLKGTRFKTYQAICQEPINQERPSALFTCLRVRRLLIYHDYSSARKIQYSSWSSSLDFNIAVWYLCSSAIFENVNTLLSCFDWMGIFLFWREMSGRVQRKCNLCTV